MKHDIMILGTVTISYNPYNGFWHVNGQLRPNGDKEMPYVVKGRAFAIRLGAMVDHFNRTGERRIFTSKEAEALIHFRFDAKSEKSLDLRRK